jgi:Mor family transcriptional regulator
MLDLPAELIPEAKDLPGDLQAIADVIGVSNTIKLAQAFRGCSIYIRNVDHLLRKKRNLEIRSSYDQGEKVVDLARRFQLSTRQIEKILSSA